MTITKIDLIEDSQSITAPWQPALIGRVNDSAIKLARFDGAFDWHLHEIEDEAFMVIQGKIAIDYKVNGEIITAVLSPNQILVMPHSVEHRPRSIEPNSLVLMFEPDSTVNTGNVITDKTYTDLKSI